jgi:hypothetical protein
MRIGLDFDNTVAIYDHAFAEAARIAGLVPSGYKGTKDDIKSLCFSLPGGEEIWMRLQGRVYGFHIGQAFLAEGLDAFLKKCRQQRAQIFIVSHKTETGHFDPDKINQRAAAMTWMESQGFFRPDIFGLDPSCVSFHPTREAKIEQIAALKLDHFVDDLEEVFLEPRFPAAVQKHLYCRSGSSRQFDVFQHWDELAKKLF